MYKIFNELITNNNVVLDSFYESGYSTLYKICPRNTPLFYMKNDSVYCIQSIEPEIEKKLSILANIEKLDAIDLISILRDRQGIVGYEIKDSNKKIMLSDIKNVPFNYKKYELIELYNNLKELHNFISVDNLSINNILSTENGLKIINWDECGFDIRYSNNNKRNDLIKMFLISITYLYGFDFEALASKYGFEEVLPFLAQHKLNNAAQTYALEFIMNHDKLLYFDDYLYSVQDINLIKKQALKRANK